MSERSAKESSPLYLGIECGGTHSVALLAGESCREVARAEFGPANLRLLSDAALVRHFREIKSHFSQPAALGIGMAGAREEADIKRILAIAGKVWANVPCHATNDLETALAAADDTQPAQASILVLSGTGSCCYGKNSAGVIRKIGGWGHLLGDKGSGYEIGMRALKAIVYYLDLDGRWTTLGKQILRVLSLNEPNELIGWTRDATKDQVAALAKEVFAANAKRDKIAADILTGAASSLAKDAVNCAKGLAAAQTPVRFIFSGSILLKQPKFAKQVEANILSRWPSAICGPLQREAVWGAVKFAKQIRNPTEKAQSSNKKKTAPTDEGKPWDRKQIAASSTEQRNPRSMNLDRMSVADAVELMLSEDAKITDAILAERRKIEWAVKKITDAFKNGGRLFYVGAGTSGRLGILDASECPPTFRADPEMVQGIIAGGQHAITNAAEGAEDDPEAGGRAIQFRGITAKDVVIGIAASGRTPFVWGALWEARKRRAVTALVCFNPKLKVRREDRPDKIIAPDIGPEVLTGSTRLKAGTATKLILNIFTTLAMTRIGKVASNLMVDVKPSNVKLRNRAIRIVSALTGLDETESKTALNANKWSVKRTYDKSRVKPKKSSSRKTQK